MEVSGQHLKILLLKLSNLTSQLGGIYFWWQAGASKYLQENCPGLRDMQVVGSSAGSLAATILMTGGDFDKAADYAIYQTTREGLWDKPTGLAFVWGAIVREWLNEIVPDIIDYKKLANLHLTATPANLFLPPTLLNNFESKKELIDACMASCHVPFFLDGKPVAKYRNEPYIDGSFWPFVGQNVIYPNPPYPAEYHASEIYYIDWTRDKAFLERQSEITFVSLITPDGLRNMMRSGYAFMKKEFESGEVPRNLKR
jgi:hypothetical protein